MSPTDPIEEKALSYMQTALVVCTSALEVLYMNYAAEQMLRAGTRLRGQRNFAAIFPANGEFIDVLAKAATNEQPTSQREILLQRPEPAPPIVVDCMATPMDGGQMLIELTNVDRLVRLNRESATKDVQAINHALVQGIAHEVKNPLGGLRGAAQLLERQLADPAQRDYTSIIIKEADRLRDLVDRMVGPRSPATHESVNVHELVEHVRTLVLTDTPTGVEIERDYDPSLPDIPGDFDGLVQALLNIVLNAIQAVDGNGVVTLATRIERQLTIAGRRQRLVVRIDVIDNGPGVPGDKIDQIFFPMVSYRDGGTGLGLSIAQDIVNRHDGIIRLESACGDTRFSLYLPAGEK